MARTDFKFSTRLRVRWSECDAQGIVFYGVYVDYLEVAQGDYYRNLGFRLYDPEGRRTFDTATVKATLEYRSPARVDDTLEIHARIAQIGTSSITYRYEAYCLDTGLLVLDAEVVCVDYDAESSASRPVPDGLRAAIEVFEATGVAPPLEDYPDLSGLSFV
jgi:acyl-CoA thioester hydrolase